MDGLGVEVFGIEVLGTLTLGTDTLGALTDGFGTATPDDGKGRGRTLLPVPFLACPLALPLPFALPFLAEAFKGPVSTPSRSTAVRAPITRGARSGGGTRLATCSVSVAQASAVSSVGVAVVRPSRGTA